MTPRTTVATLLVVLLALFTLHCLPKLSLMAKATMYELACEDAPKTIPEKGLRYSFAEAINEEESADEDGTPAARSQPASTVKLSLLFIRHGHSFWNAIRATSDPEWHSFVMQLLKKEAMSFTNPMDSALYDAPLTGRGLEESLELQQYINANFVSEPLKSFVDAKKGVLLVSNLRRAMETALVGFAGVFQSGSSASQLVVDSSLQEGCCHIDALSLMEHPRELPPVVLQTAKWQKDTRDEKVVDVQLTNAADVQATGAFSPEMKYNKGNKNESTNVFNRQDDFIDNIVEHHKLHGKTHIAAIGHSAWFRRFFLRFLPQDSTHLAKATKLHNCGAVSFDIHVDVEKRSVAVPAETIRVLHRGFIV